VQPSGLRAGPCRDGLQVEGRGPKAGPTTGFRFFFFSFQFKILGNSFKLQKIILNCLKLRKMQPKICMNPLEKIYVVD
jgi:hypothetical protein